MALKIIIETVDHADQRYPTVGDWYYGPDAAWHIRVSNMSNWKHELCVAVHELCEMGMCVSDGISQTEVDQFDQRYEANRPRGDFSEPGDCGAAPYYRQHSIASGIERVLATELKVDWRRYSDEVESL